jgi:hypothetical protein
MYSFIVKHKGQNIINRILTPDELIQINILHYRHSSLTSLSDAFKTYIGLDISNYKLSECIISDESFIVYIRTEDLEECRNNKLNELGL